MLRRAHLTALPEQPSPLELVSRYLPGTCHRVASDDQNHHLGLSIPRQLPLASRRRPQLSSEAAASLPHKRGLPAPLLGPLDIHARLLPTARTPQFPDFFSARRRQTIRYL